ncbi:MAG: hypothetical protein ACKOW9_03245 [Candidatus Paceibacterota bacterium]
MLSENTQRALRIYGDDILLDIISRLRKMNAFASGKLEASFNYKVQVAISELKLLIYAEQYAEAIDTGRRAGLTPPPIKPILEWVKLKNIPEGLAYPIQKSIGKYGITPRPYIRQVINKAITTDSLKNLENAWKADLKLILDDLIRQTNKK